jgi:glycosyltransferase involved in cell wall biosynthesis
MVCRCEVGYIKSVLNSILAQEEPPGGLEFIVADGMSEDGTREVLEEIARSDFRVTVIDNVAKITSTGLNAAIRATRGKIIVRMDAHTHYAPDYIKRCVEVLEQTGADNVGGPWIAQASGYLGEAIAAAFQSRFAVGGARSHVANYEGPVDTVYLGCWKKETFQRFGEFDEKLIRNQDDEHNLRIVRQGGKIWQSPKIKSRYHSRTTLPQLFRQYMQYGYWKVQVIRKHKRPASLRHLVPGIFLLNLLLLSLVSIISYSALALAAPGSALASLSFTALTSALLMLCGTLGAYAFTVLLASLEAASRSKWRLLPILPVVFICFHFGYGWGFLRGVFDAVFGISEASSSATRLTREVPARQL